MDLSLEIYHKKWLAAAAFMLELVGGWVGVGEGDCLFRSHQKRRG